MNEERRKADRRVPPAVAQHAIEERAALLAQVETLTEWYSNALDTIRALEADRGRIKRIADNYSALNMDAQAELAALKAQPSGVVLDWLRDDESITDRLKLAGWAATHDAQWDNAESLRCEILQALTAPPTPDATQVMVPRELLERITMTCYPKESDVAELRALLAQHEGVKP